MKLRNKKTGEVVNVIVYSPIGNYNIRIWKDKDYLDPTCNDDYLGDYKTLAELNDEWEDYKPAEPLIKDEKVRKAVRAWAEANGFNTARYSSVNDCFCHQGNMMFVEPSYELEQLDSLGYKTITELCGEGEECES